MGRQKLLLVLASFAFSCCKGQVFDFTPLQPTAFDIGFNHFFIERNHIKYINVVEFSKADNQLIEDQGNGSHYEFNPKGFMSFTTSWEARTRTMDEKGRNKYVHDTIEQYCTYDSAGHLTILRTITKPQQEWFNSFYYTYNSLGFATQTVNCWENNTASTPARFIAGIQKMKSLESYSYEILNKEQIKKTFINDENRPYKEGIMHLSPQGKLVQESFHYTHTWLKENNSYAYNEYGFITEKKCHSNDGFDQQEAYTYEMDEKGQVKTVCLFKNGAKVFEISFLYDLTGVPTSEVKRDFIKKYIYISRFSYGYY